MGNLQQYCALLYTYVLIELLKFSIFIVKYIGSQSKVDVYDEGQSAFGGYLKIITLLTLYYPIISYLQRNYWILFRWLLEILRHHAIIQYGALYSYSV